jgi:hypothetical protein
MIATASEDHANTDNAAEDSHERSTIEYLAPKVHVNIRRQVLDESGHSREAVLEALKSQNTDRIANSAVPGTCGILTNTEAAVSARIITSIGMNCVESNRSVLASALELEKETLRGHERHRLDQIKQGRTQMNMLSAARSQKEEEYREEEDRLPKLTSRAIACLSMREIADRVLKDALSKSTELTGEFTDEHEFEKLIWQINRENACDVRRRGEAAMKETHYWPIIKQRAEMMAPLPASSGKKTGLTPQEKYTARRLVMALGYGRSKDSILKARSYLKLLSDLREAGVTLLLLYRTREFKTYFLRHPNDLTTVLSWHQHLHPRLHQLRLRTIAQAEGDFSGRCDLEDQDILHRLRIPQGLCWRDDLSDWGDLTERDKYLAEQSIQAVSGKSNTHVLQYGPKGGGDGNKSIYVSMVPYEGISAKRTVGSKPPSTKLLALSPLVSISPGDFLGVFPGRLRYTDTMPPGAIHGPVPGLWLDRSEVKGKLHWIKAAKSGEQTNVCLMWEGVNEVKGEKSFCQYWRILVLATRDIMPFDQLIRPA